MIFNQCSQIPYICKDLSQFDQYKYFMIIKLLNIFIVILLLCLTSQNSPQTPIIGIYTQVARNFKNLTKSYIAASYVKYLEMSGAQVVPIFYNQSQKSLLSLLNQINGVLFPGGGMDFNLSQRWTTNADYILKYAIEQNKQGKIFPVWGTCMGHQLLSYLTDNYSDLLVRVQGQNPIVNTLQISDKSSDIFKNWSQQHFLSATKGSGVFYYAHNWAVLASYFKESQYLSSFWNLVATTTSPHGQQFTSAQVAKQYPFYSTQFHPEKNPFEWLVDANRTKNSIEMVQLLSQTFVEKARQNPNHFENSNELNAKLIYNFATEQPGNIYDLASFQELYIFNQPTN